MQQNVIYNLVSVTDRCHGYNSPPERIRDAVDGGVVNVQLDVVDCTRVEQYTREQSHYEDAETLEAGSDRCYQYLHDKNSQHKWLNL